MQGQDGELRLPREAWVSMLRAPGVALTLEQVRTLCAIDALAHLQDLNANVADLQARVMRLELFQAAVTPAYDAVTRELVSKSRRAAEELHALKALRGGTDG